MVVTSDGHNTYLLNCEFDDVQDDYADDYDVYLLPPLSQADLLDSWIELPQRAVRKLGRVSVRDVRFDETRRRQIDATVFEQFG